MKENAPRFWFFHEWLDRDRRFWAEPHFFDSVAQAREAHVAASAFYWVTGKMTEPSISGLFARDAVGNVTIQQPCRPGEDPTRPPLNSSGAGKVSSVVKAEAQRRDLGSTPSGSTELPF